MTGVQFLFLMDNKFKFSVTDPGYIYHMNNWFIVFKEWYNLPHR